MTTDRTPEERLAAVHLAHAAQSLDAGDVETALAYARLAIHELESAERNRA